MFQPSTSPKVLSTHRALALTALALMMAVASLRQAQAQSDPQILSANQTVERALKGGETHFFQFSLKQGEYARAEVEQNNIELLVSLFDMDGKLIAEMDGNNIDLWRESLSVIAERGGNYKLQIKANGRREDTGSYTVKLAELHASTDRGRKRIEAEQAVIEALKLDHQNNSKDAARVYEIALRLWREVEGKYWEAVTMTNLGWVYHFTNQDDKALELHNGALNLFREVKDRMGESIALGGIGMAFHTSHKDDLAKNSLEQALAIRRELKRPRSEYRTLNGLVLVYGDLKQSEKVLESLNRMLAISRELQDRSLEAEVLKGFGSYYLGMDRYSQVIDYYGQALPIYRDELKDKKKAGDILKILGLIYGRSGEYEKARDYLEQIVALKKEIGDKSDDWDMLKDLGLVYQALNQNEKALAYYEQALAIAKTLKDERHAEGIILGQIGGLYASKWQQNEKARGYLEAALVIARATKNNNYESSALRDLASVYLGLGNFEKAEDYSQQSLAIERKYGKGSESLALSSLGLLYLSTGKYEKAKATFEQALVIVKELGDRNSECSILSSLALASSFLDQFEKAREYSEQSLRIAREQKSPRHVFQALNNLGLACIWLSQFEKARGYYEESLAIARALNNRSFEGTTLNSLGGICLILSDYEKAKAYQEQSLAIAREVKNRHSESITLVSLGKVYANLSQYEKAREYYEQGLTITKELNNRLGEYDALINLGFACLGLNQYDEARNNLEKAKNLIKEIKTPGREIDLLAGFGAISSDLSKQSEAANYYQQSLTILKDLKNRRGEGILLNALGETQMELKAYAKAKGYFEQALAVAVEVKNQAGEATAIINLGRVCLSLKQYEKAQSYFQQGLAIAKEVKGRADEGYAVNGLGELSFKRNQYKKAQDFYQQALMIAREIKSKKLEGRVLWNLMGLLNQQKIPRLASFYGKQAINAFQEIRGNIKGFDKETQHSFLKDKESAYRTLANILIAQNRLTEAQAVLDLLKEEEFSGLVRGSGGTPTTPYSQAEGRAIEIINLLAATGREYHHLLEKNDTLSKTAQGALSDDEKARVIELRNDLNVGKEKYQQSLDALQSEAKNSQSYETVSKEAGALQEDLRELGGGTVALYTVLVDNEQGDITNGWIILVTPDFPKAYSIEVKDLKQVVFDFHKALSDPTSMPEPLAKALYKKLFLQTSNNQKTTLEADLDAYLQDKKDKTLMWSLDGVLRYVPMAALHDGKGYLVEKYRNVVFDTASKARLKDQVNPHWTALGLGVTEERQEAGFTFPPLPGADGELNRIIKDQASTAGILQGVVKKNKEFTHDSMIDGLLFGKPSVVHIASHFSLQVADFEQSFLLLGEGRWTVQGMKKETTLFRDVDLVTLSACDTAMGNANGKEAEGFGYLVQSLGAKAVMASLWQVDDVGTQVLMPAFYRMHETGLGKAEALRQAQLALLYGKYLPDDSDKQRGPVSKHSGKKESRATFAHPYYWASFILIGNWR